MYKVIYDKHNNIQFIVGIIFLSFRYSKIPARYAHTSQTHQNDWIVENLPFGVTTLVEKQVSWGFFCFEWGG